MEEQPQQLPNEPAPPPAVPPQPQEAAAVYTQEPKKTFSFLRILVVFLVLAGLAAGGYYVYTTLTANPQEDASKPSQRVTLPVQQQQPAQGFGSQTQTEATPTLTSSDAVADIERDLTGTAIEPGNTKEFDSDLQGL